VRAKTIVVVIALLAVACGGSEGTSEDGSETDGVASIRSSDSDDSVEPRIAFEEGLLQFTACMRDNGADIADIQVNADGQPILSTGLVEGIDTQSSEFDAALVACIGILADASPVQIGADPELQAAVQDTLRDFSACMRSNGVENFPDPAPGFDGRGFPYPLTALDTIDEDLDGALETCSELLSFPGVG